MKPSAMLLAPSLLALSACGEANPLTPRSATDLSAERARPLPIQCPLGTANGDTSYTGRCPPSVIAPLY